MATWNIKVSPALDARLRQHTHRKGDLSTIVSEAVTEWLNKREVKQTPADAIAELASTGAVIPNTP